MTLDQAAAGVAASQAAGSGLRDTLVGLLAPTALAEAAALVVCLLLAWAVVRIWRRRTPVRSSIWIGERVVDGVSFPALALAAALIARYALRDMVPIALFNLALPVLTSLLLIRIVVRVLRAAFPRSGTARLLERTLSWLVWGGMVLWVTGIAPMLLAEMQAIHWKLGDTEVSLRSLVEGALSAAAVLVGALWVSAAIEARLMAGAEGSGYRLSLRKIAANATRAFLLLVGLLLALSAAGIPLSAFGVLVGALGVGIGFGLQKLAANYVSGFVILAERSLSIGDIVKVDGFEGRITDIHGRYTVVRAFDGRESIVPNEMLISHRVEKASLMDTRQMLTSSVGVAYGTDLQTLASKLIAAVAAVPRVLADPPPDMQLSAFGVSALELTIAFWIGDPQHGQGNVRSLVNLAILRTLGESGVEIRGIRDPNALPARPKT